MMKKKFKKKNVKKRDVGREARKTEAPRQSWKLEREWVQTKRYITLIKDKTNLSAKEPGENLLNALIGLLIVTWMKF